MGNQETHAEKQHHINMGKGDIAPTVLIPGDPGRVEVFASLMDDAKKIAEKAHKHYWNEFSQGKYIDRYTKILNKVCNEKK